MSGRRARILAWSAWLVIVAMGAFSAALGGALNDIPAGLVGLLLLGIPILVYATVGAVVASSLPRNPIGWLLILFTVSAVGSQAVSENREAALGAGGTTYATATFAAWLGEAVLNPIFYLSLAFAFLLFPDGRLPGPRWRAVVATLTLTLLVSATARALSPGPIPNAEPFINPFGLQGDSGRIASLLGPAMLPAASLLFVAAGAALAIRWRRSAGDGRLQLKWIAAVALPLLFDLAVLAL